MSYYDERGFEIDRPDLVYGLGSGIKYSKLNNEYKRVLSACQFMVEQEASIRVAAFYYNFSTSTLWRRIHKVCKELSPVLYDKVVKRMSLNLERSRKQIGQRRIKNNN